MTDTFDSGTEGPPSHRVTVNGGTVGAIGDHAHIENVTPRRLVAWPVSTGSPPPLASAFQPRTYIEDRMRGSLPTVLRGGGGTGKSQVAVRVYASSTADLRVWVSGESRVSVITGYADAAVQLDLADADSGPENLARRFLSFLAGTDRPWLMVVDDLTDPANIVDLWPSGAGQVVVTTRRRDAALSGGGRIIVDVDAYSPEEAHSYLRERLSPLADELPDDALEQAGQLAQDLGYLPLALSQAAAVVIDQAVSCTEYREWFADRTRKLNELFPTDANADGYAKTIATTWVLAIDTADQLEPLRLSRPLATLAACFDPAGTPEAVYTSEPALQYLAAETGQELVSIATARKALRALNRLSLVTHDARQEPPTVRMHNLTGRAILQTHTNEDITRLVHIAIAALDQAWPQIENNPALSELLRGNTAVLRQLDPDAMWGGKDNDGVASVLFRSGRSLLSAGLVAPAMAYFRDLVDECADHLGTDHPDTLTSRNNLAYAYRSAGNLQRAIPLYQRTLADRERVLGADHPDTLSSRNNLAGAYESAGDLKRALPLYEQTLTDRERVLGADHPDTLNSRNNLAYAYRSAGDLRRAIPLHEQTVAARERVLGADHPDTLTSRNNLGYAYRLAGDLERAIPLQEQTLKDRERVLGADHPATLTSRNNLAHAYESAGDLQRAIPLYEQTVADLERVLGADHPNTLTSRNNLAHAYASAGDLSRAIALQEHTLADLERVLGSDHPSTLTSRSNLAGAYQSAGDLSRAVPLYEQTLTDRERVLGTDHPDTLTSRNNVATAHSAAGDRT